MRRHSALYLVLVTCAILVGCDRCSKEKDAVSSDTAGTSGESTVTTTPDGAAAMTPAAESATELQIVDVTVGTGLEATDGKKVTVNYTGTLVDGTKFDSSKDRQTPFPFTLGSGMVIAGWEQGVKGMKEGGVRKLTIPPNLAYGNRGVGNAIPPNSTLIFEIELLKVE